jgi:hypothetical protein
MLARSAFVYIAAAALVTTPVLAHNVVCGVSIRAVMGSADVKDKWKSDSDAIAALGHFYLGISQLQLIEVDDLTKGEAQQLQYINNAKIEFIRAIQGLDSAIQTGRPLVQRASGEERNISERSLANYAKLRDMIAQFVGAIEGKSLPETVRIHDALEIVKVFRYRKCICNRMLKGIPPAAPA